MAFALVTICLLSIFNPILVLPSSASTSFIPLDPSVTDSRGWDDAWTETIFGNGTPPFKTIVYSNPQVAWNGTQWVKYEIKPINETAVILRTPTCSYLVGELAVSLFDPQGTLHVGGMDWLIEQYSVTLNKWLPKSVETASVSYNSTHIWQKWAFPDKSERELYIDHNNKQTIIFTSKTSATIRMVWHFTDINATRITYSNGRQTKLGKGTEISLTDFNFTKLTLYDQDKFSLSIDYNDIDPSYYSEFFSEYFEGRLAYVDLIYGNWTTSSNESIKVDPETETFNSEAELDGTIYKKGQTYPPTDIGNFSEPLYIGQLNILGWFYVYRGYVSFNTSSIRDYAIINNVTLKMKTDEDHSFNDFTMRVMGGSQPIYGSSLETDDWNCGTTEVATWSSSEYPGDDIYVNITIPTDQINVTGRTQFEFKSNREGAGPSGDEYVVFHSGESTGSEPLLEITWGPYEKHIDGQWWYYFNSTTNEKAVIVLFGGYVDSRYKDRVFVQSLFMQNPKPYHKEKFVQDLHSNGFDVLSPKNDTIHTEVSLYTGTKDWVKNATIWLTTNQKYKYVFLFGFSAGGVVAAYEIQQDYTDVLSAAVIASAPVDWDDFSSDPIFQSAHTSNETKICTSFLEAKGDGFYSQMLLYHDNMIVHREWHNWNNGTDPHDVFKNTCADHPDETVFDATYNWYQHRHLTVLAQDQYGNNLTTGDVYIDNEMVGYTGSTFSVDVGTYAVFVNDFWESGTTGYRYGWENWTDGSVDNPRNITVLEDTTITAYFIKKWCPGDVNGDGIVDMSDLYFVALLFGAQRGDSNWDSRADLNRDLIIDVSDMYIVALYYGEEY